MEILLAFFGGMLFLAFVIFAVYLVMAVRELNATGKSLHRLLEPVVGDKSLTETMAAIKILVAMVPRLGADLGKLSGVFEKFNSIMLAEQVKTTPALDPALDPSVASNDIVEVARRADELVHGGPAGKTANAKSELQSAFYGYDEAEQAKIEEQDALRKSGIETNDKNAPHVPIEQHKTEGDQ